MNIRKSNQDSFKAKLILSVLVISLVSFLTFSAASAWNGPQKEPDSIAKNESELQELIDNDGVDDITDSNGDGFLVLGVGNQINLSGSLDVKQPNVYILSNSSSRKRVNTSEHSIDIKADGVSVKGLEVIGENDQNDSTKDKGIRLQGSRKAINISDNILRGSWEPIIFEAVVDSHEDIVISDNDISGEFIGIMAFTVNNSIIKNNSIHDIDNGIQMSIYKNSSQKTPTNNLIKGNDFYNLVEEGNSPDDGNWYYGVLLQGKNTTFVENSFSGGGEFGLLITDSITVYGTSDRNISNNLVFNNTFTNHSLSGLIETEDYYSDLSPSGYSVEAIGNWWGNSTGPSVEGPGDGDGVNNSVAFRPWLTEERGSLDVQNVTVDDIDPKVNSSDYLEGATVHYSEDVEGVDTDDIWLTYGGTNRTITNVNENSPRDVEYEIDSPIQNFDESLLEISFNRTGVWDTAGNYVSYLRFDISRPSSPQDIVFTQGESEFNLTAANFTQKCNLSVNIIQLNVSGFNEDGPEISSNATIYNNSFTDISSKKFLRINISDWPGIASGGSTIYEVNVVGENSAEVQHRGYAPLLKLTGNMSDLLPIFKDNETTQLSEEEDWTNITDPVFSTDYGKVDFNGTLNLFEEGGIISLFNMSNTFEVSRTKARLEVNPNDTSYAIKGLNLSAKIELYNFTDEGIDDPVIMKDGVECTSLCSNVSTGDFDGYGNNDDIRFDVEHWTTYSVAQKEEEEDTTSSSGGSSYSSDENVTKKPTAKHVWASLDKGEVAEMTIDNPNISVRSMNLKVNVDVSSLSMEVKSYGKDVPENVEEVPNEAYEYLDISHSELDETIDSVNITFTVSADWLDENNINSSNVRLYHHEDGEWTSLETELLNEGSQEYEFEAETDSFSFFAVSGEGLTEEETTEEQTVTEGETTTEETTQENVTAEEDVIEDLEEESNGTYQVFVFSLIALVAIALVLIYYGFVKPK